MDLATYKSKLDKLEGNFELLVSKQKDSKEKVAVWKAKMQALEQSQALIQKVSSDMNKLIAYSLADITQAMLDSVFPSEYKVKLDFAIKNNRTHVDIYLDMNGEKIYPLDQDGGGVANMMELGLRLASLQLGKTRRTIVLDQPLKDLSKEYITLGADILKKISKDLGIQLIIINHTPELMEIADRTIEIVKDTSTGISSVRSVT